MSQSLFWFTCTLCPCILDTYVYRMSSTCAIIYKQDTLSWVLLSEAKWQNDKINDIFKTVSALCKVLAVKKWNHSLGSVRFWSKFLLSLFVFVKNTPLWALKCGKSLFLVFDWHVTWTSSYRHPYITDTSLPEAIYTEIYILNMGSMIQTPHRGNTLQSCIQRQATLRGSIVTI